MIVLRSTYDKLALEYRILQVKYGQLLVEWNNLVERVNQKGGEQFLLHGSLARHDVLFTDDDIKRLINLCHPDKHGGKQAAVDITQKLLKMRG